MHDAARPFATLELYRRVIAAVAPAPTPPSPAIEVTDTIKVVDAPPMAASRVRRSSRRLTARAWSPCRPRRPSGRRLLRAAHGQAGSATDDAALVEAFGGRVVVVTGEPSNRKITEPDDLEWARRLAADRALA